MVRRGAPSGEVAIPSLYPDHVPPHQGHPTTEQFEIVDPRGIGAVVLSRAAFRRGVWIARFDGVTVGYLTQHSLQKGARLHLVDMHFVGLLAHACEPNTALDMARQNLHALRDIAPGDMLTIDYDSTEDELFAPFVCRCGAPSCRGAIRGRLQAVNRKVTEGEALAPTMGL